ncbi:MAG TPA: hypothetical protein VHX87_06085 [Galbitalea sp.]|nr:hypothetical protein [Galbitalea sp.]
MMRRAVGLRASVAASIAAAMLVVGALAGCAQAGATPPSTPKPTSSIAGALDSLLPVVPKKLTAASAKKATDNLAKSIDALVAGSDIVYIDNHEKLIPATTSAAATYAVIRTINVSPSLDPLQQAEAMEKLLVAAGWKLEDHSSAKGKYLAAMSSSVDPSQAWFLLLGGDSTVPKQPVVTVQLASPDLPRK